MIFGDETVIGYLFLFLAVFMGALRGYCGKKTSGIIANVTDGLFLHAFRMLLCVGIGAVLLLFSSAPAQIDGTVLWIALLSGVCNAFFMLGWLFSVRSGAYLLVDMCSAAGGILLPCFCGILWLGETVSGLQVIGVVLMLAAVYVMCGYNNSVKSSGLSRGALWLLLSVALTSGGLSFAEKLFMRHVQWTGLACDTSTFSLLTFAFSALVLFLAVAAVCKRTGQPVAAALRDFPLKRLWLYVVVMAAAMFLNTYLGVLTNAYITDTVLIYPLKFGSNLVLAAIMAAVLFGERINWRSLLGMVLVTASILCINVFG